MYHSIPTNSEQRLGYEYKFPWRMFLLGKTLVAAWLDRREKAPEPEKETRKVAPKPPKSHQQMVKTVLDKNGKSIK